MNVNSIKSVFGGDYRIMYEKRVFIHITSINFLVNTYFVRFGIRDEWKIQNLHIPDRKS